MAPGANDFTVVGRDVSYFEFLILPLLEKNNSRTTDQIKKITLIYAHRL